MTIQHLSTNELVERLRVSRSTLERWRTNGVGPPFIKVGSRVIYRIGDVEDWEQAHARRSTGQAIES